MPSRVLTFAGESLVVDQVYRSCLITIHGCDTWADLIVLDVLDFDVILGLVIPLLCGLGLFS